MQLQQGDVLLRKAERGVSGKKLNHLTLAKGESTGHHHTITKGTATLYDVDGTFLLDVKSDEAILTHQEHNPVTIPHGVWQVGIVQEYDHFAEEARRVAD